MSFNDRFGGFPVLETERLVLREVRPEEDAAAHHRLWSDPRIVENTPDPYVESVEDSLARLQRLKGWFYDETYVLGWAIARKEDDGMIGGLRYYAFTGCQYRIGEVGYELSPEHWNKGYMTEALKAAADFGFTIGLNRVQLTTMTTNTASQRVALKAGFQQEGVLRQWEFNRRTNEWRDMVMFSVVRERASQKP